MYPRVAFEVVVVVELHRQRSCCRAGHISWHCRRSQQMMKGSAAEGSHRHWSQRWSGPPEHRFRSRILLNRKMSCENVILWWPATMRGADTYRTDRWPGKWPIWIRESRVTRTTMPRRHPSTAAGRPNAWRRPSPCFPPKSSCWWSAAGWVSPGSVGIDVKLQHVCLTHGRLWRRWSLLTWVLRVTLSSHMFAIQLQINDSPW